MACNLTRSKVARIVLSFLRTVLTYRPIREDKSFERDLRVDSWERSMYYFEIAPKIVEAGCSLEPLTPLRFGQAQSIGKLVDLVWDAVKKNKDAAAAAKKKTSKKTKKTKKKTTKKTI